ncbi:MAG: VWA domain-containing protein [Myxococcales bacterium]|nr:VWA domain-containing protein [Myxococcales bacterium]
MSRRRRDERRDAEAFGTSLADILTTALGCVLLLFLVAVMHIRGSLDRAQAALVAEADRRAAAETERRAALDRRRAAEDAARRAAAETRGAEDALTLARTERDALIAERDALLADREALIAAAAAAQTRAEHLEGAARDALAGLDPRTARPVDLVLVVDGTRSMRKSLDATRDNLRATLDALRVVSPTARIGAVVFRDRREPPDLRLETAPLTASEATLGRFLAGIEATSTAVDDDAPEWLCGGLAAAIAADWRQDAIRLVIVASDAAADDPGAAPCLEDARRFAAAGGRIHVVTTRPPARLARQIRRQHAAIAAAGDGIHVDGGDAEALLTEVLRAAFRERTAAPIERLRRAVDAAPAAPAPEDPIDEDRP